jgi:hypothetical protein
MNKLIINPDVLMRTPVTQVRRHVDDGRTVPRQENISYLNPRT